LDAQPLYPVAIATLTAIAFSAAAIRLHRPGTRLLWLIPISGLLLLGVAIFGLIPEVAQSIGWPRALLMVAVGLGLLIALDRFAFSVCPACSHDHDHQDCARKLHGFLAPLVAATAIHAFVDGWGLTTVAVVEPRFAASIATAILLHKIPEGLALGTMLRAATGRVPAALFWAIGVESCTLSGGLVGLVTPSGDWLHYPLGIAGGTFLFLGGHALHAAWTTHRKLTPQRPSTR